jgi:ectoine hydroxylase-related dioxygenase (phytanoyl-CoA dioxygenase family)
MRRKVFIDDKHNEKYLEKGYIEYNLFNEREVNQILNELTAESPDDNFNPQNRLSDYHCTFLDSSEEYKRNVIEVSRKWFKPIVDKLLNDYEIWVVNFYVKPPGKGELTIHQNWMHITEEKHSTFTIWCPLVDCTVENGTLELVEASHKVVPDIATLGVPYYFENFEKELLNNHLFPIERKAGQGIVFEDNMIHYTAANQSKNPRYALQVIVGPKEVKPVYYYYRSDTNEFEVYELNDDFLITSNYENMSRKPSDFILLDRIPNKNKLLSYNEFLEVMKKGKERRNEIFG